MGRKPLPLGSWGLIRTYPVGDNGKGKPRWVKAVAQYRDFDGVKRQVQASGKSATAATQNLRQKLQNRTQSGGHGDLTARTTFSEAADLWLARVDELVSDGRRSPGTVDTYRRQLKNHIIPAMGAVRLGEATTPLVDKVIAAIKADVSAPTARSCRSVISGVMSLSVRYGAVAHNPVREVERIESRPKRQPRALTNDERVELLRQLGTSEKALRRDLPDLVLFMLATGVRIGEALGHLVVGGRPRGWHGADHEHAAPSEGRGPASQADQEPSGGADAAAASQCRGGASAAVHDRGPG